MRPNGIGAAEGNGSAVWPSAAPRRSRLQVDQPGFTAACDKIDAPIHVSRRPDYEKYVVANVAKEKVMIERSSCAS
jgi:hypothetical protein